MISSHLKIRNIDQHQLTGVVRLCEHYPELNWNPEKLQSSLNATSTLALGLFIDEVLACFCFGFIVLNEAELLLTATDASFLKRGYASQLLQEFLNQACARGVKRFFLEVRASNIKAIRLYERLGFKRIHVRKAYYPCAEGREDALVMELSFADN